MSSNLRRGIGWSRSTFAATVLLPRIRRPVLVTHGARDAVVKPAVVEQHTAAIPHAQVQSMREAGHAAFWDDPGEFNERLHAFCETP